SFCPFKHFLEGQRSRLRWFAVHQRPPSRAALPFPAAYVEKFLRHLEVAGHAFGVALPGKALHGDNLKSLQAELGKWLGTGQGDAAGKLAGALSRWYQVLGVDRETPAWSRRSAPKPSCRACSSSARSIRCGCS